MHLEKCANGGEAARCHHNSRKNMFEYDGKGNVIKIHSSNEDINPAMSKYNRNLTSGDGRTDMQRFKDRLEQLSYRKQKNNVRMEEICIHAPKNLPKQEMGKFFKVAHATLQEMTGGAVNEISAWVHFDERSKSPHMHYLFVPGIKIEGVEKLSAKTLMGRAAINQLHPTMQAAVDKAFNNHKYLVVADDPADRAKSSDSMKVYKAKMQKLDEVNQEIVSAAKDLQMTIDSVNRVKSGLDNLNRKRDAALDEISKLENLKAELSGNIDAAEQNLQTIHDKLHTAEELCNSVKEYFSYDEWWRGQAELFGFGFPDNSKTYANWMDSADGQIHQDLEGFQQDIQGCIEDIGDLGI